jgi:hypothetical protein
MAASNTIDVNTNISAGYPINHAVVVVPNDGADLAFVTTAIYVGTSGNMQVTTLGGETVQFLTMPVGWHPIRATRIWATNTSALGIVAGWR